MDLGAWLTVSHAFCDSFTAAPPHLGRMEARLPVIRAVMRVVRDGLKQSFWFEDEPLIGDHAPRDGQDGAKDSDVEEDILLESDFEMHK